MRSDILNIIISALIFVASVAGIFLARRRHQKIRIKTGSADVEIEQ